MEEQGYVRPEQFLFGVVTSVVLGTIMNAATQPRQAEGRQTMANTLSPELSPMEIVGRTQDEMASALEIMESGINYGDKARVTLCTEALPDEAQLAEMYLGMLSTGHHVSYPTASVVGSIPTTEFVIKKGSPFWPLIIPILVPLFTVGLVAFGITKIETIARALVPIILISIGGLIVLAAVLSKPATKYIERGGKIPYLPETKSPSELEQKVKGLWAKACEWDKIPSDSKFVVFSDDNPYLKEYNEAVKQLLRFAQFKTGEWKPAVTKSSKKALAVR